MSLAELPWFIWEIIISYLPGRDKFLIAQTNRESRERLLLICKEAYMREKLNCPRSDGKHLERLSAPDMEKTAAISMLSQRKRVFVKVEKPKPLIMRDPQTGTLLQVARFAFSRARNLLAFTTYRDCHLYVYKVDRWGDYALFSRSLKIFHVDAMTYTPGLPFGATLDQDQYSNDVRGVSVTRLEFSPSGEFLCIHFYRKTLIVKVNPITCSSVMLDTHEDTINFGHLQRARNPILRWCSNENVSQKETLLAVNQWTHHLTIVDFCVEQKSSSVLCLEKKPTALVAATKRLMADIAFARAGKNELFSLSLFSCLKKCKSGLHYLSLHRFCRDSQQFQPEEFFINVPGKVDDIKSHEGSFFVLLEASDDLAGGNNNAVSISTNDKKQSICPGEFESTFLLVLKIDPRAKTCVYLPTHTKFPKTVFDTLPQMFNSINPRRVLASYRMNSKMSGNFWGINDALYALSTDRGVQFLPRDLNAGFQPKEIKKLGHNFCLTDHGILYENESEEQIEFVSFFPSVNIMIQHRKDFRCSHYIRPKTRETKKNPLRTLKQYVKENHQSKRRKLYKLE